MLRVGAILCPYCDSDLWTMAHGGPAPSREAASDSVADAPLDASAPGDGRLGRGALVLAAVALGATIFPLLISAPADASSWLWSLWSWPATMMAVAAIYLAHKAGVRLPGTRNARRPTAATYALLLGMANVALVATTLITWSIDQVVGNIHA
jgi:hypothetical protein